MHFPSVVVGGVVGVVVGSGVVVVVIGAVVVGSVQVGIATTHLQLVLSMAYSHSQDSSHPGLSTQLPTLPSHPSTHSHCLLQTLLGVVVMSGVVVGGLVVTSGVVVGGMAVGVVLVGGAVGGNVVPIVVVSAGGVLVPDGVVSCAVTQACTFSLIVKLSLLSVSGTNSTMRT